MIFSSACALERFISYFNDYSSTSPFDNAQIFGNVPVDLKDSLDNVFPTNTVQQKSGINHNYYGVPTRGLISDSDAAGSDATDIMVSLMWSYETDELADKANKEL